MFGWGLKWDSDIFLHISLCCLTSITFKVIFCREISEKVLGKYVAVKDSVKQTHFKFSYTQFHDADRQWKLHKQLAIVQS